MIGYTAAVLFVATVWLANWLLARYGVVNIGFGLYAPAGVFAIGAALVLRDIVQRTLGRAWVIGCIITGCALAFLIESDATIPGGVVPIAVASAAAFLFSETADMAVYTPLQQRTFLGAVAASNIVGAIIDSCLFLWLAFGSVGWTLMQGQLVGKMYMTLLAVPFLLLSRRRFAC